MPSSEVVRRLREGHNIWLGLGPYKGDRLRAVTNLMVTKEDIDTVLKAMTSIVGQHNRDLVDRNLGPFREPNFAMQ